MGQVYLSERTETFKAHGTLFAQPVTFATHQVKGAIFYLPKEHSLGGDSFIIHAGQTLTASLLADVKGDGRIGRARIEPLIPNLEQLAAHAASEPFHDRDVLNDVAKLDKQAGYEAMFALSLVRIENTGNAYLLNEGENLALVRKQGTIQYLSEQLSHGKVGMFNLTLKGKTVQDAITFYEEHFHPGDRILLCTDGVYERSDAEADNNQTIEEIAEIFRTAASPRDTVTDINKHIREKLLSTGLDSPEDDYTIVCIERK